jgi:hypothetical protein
MMGFLRRLLGVPEPPAPEASEPKIRRMPGVIFDRSPSRVAVVGESFRQDTLDALGGHRSDRGVERAQHMAALIPEPDNPVDPAAISVQIEGRLVGYLSHTDARAYGPILDLVRAKGYGVGCHASLLGGWERGPDRGSIGVVLHIGSPPELMAELRDGGLLSESVALGLPEPEPPLPATTLTAPGDLGDLVGRNVCFTGESVCTVGGVPLSRPTQEVLAANAGLHVLPRATKKLDLLVVSPLAGHTGKVAKAEEYGIPRVDEPAFWRALGVRID